MNHPFCHDSFPMGPARSISPRLIIPGPRARVARCQCSSDIHESRGAHTCFRMRVSRMVHYGPHQAESDATPIARGNTPLTIPILITQTYSMHAACNIQHTAYNIQHAACNMQHAACNMQHATYSMQRATCSMQHATCNMQHAAGNKKHAACNIKHATCNMQRVICNMQHATCNLQHATYKHTACSMQHTACNIRHTAYSIQNHADTALSPKHHAHVAPVVPFGGWHALVANAARTIGGTLLEANESSERPRRQRHTD